MYIHILGICGTFMGGIAAIAAAAGHRVTGSDVNVYPPMSTQLASQGIALTEGYGADQLGLNPDLWLVGNVISRGNPLIEAILDRGDRYVSGPQWLADNILRARSVFAVAGTHGKTTTASMLTWILEDAGLEPGFLIGGVPQNFEVSARLGGGDIFVIEADEYDTAFFDKRSKMIHYRPRVAVLNNLEFDHADIFADLSTIEIQFHHLVRTVPRSGRLIVNGDDTALGRVLARGYWTPVEYFGVREGWYPANANADSFDIAYKDAHIGRVRWGMLGEHNRMNATAAIAAAHAAGVDPASAVQALARYRGVKRRLELRGTARGITVWDDFAHHPTAIATTIAGLRDKVANGRVLAVLEPRSNTMKLGVMNERLAASLEGADRTFCYSANLGWDAVAALAPLGARASCETDLEHLIASIVAEARPGDQVLVMSNGGFGGIHERLLAALGDRAAVNSHT